MFEFHSILLLSFALSAKFARTVGVEEDWLVNTNPIGSPNNPMKYKYTTNQAIDGPPIAIHQSASMAHCVYGCRTHLQCRSATFWNNLTCHFHSRASANGLTFNNQAITIDFGEQNKTHLLLTGGSYMVEFIPETKMIKLLNEKPTQARTRHAAAMFGGRILLDGGTTGTAADYIQSTVVLSGVPVVEVNASTYSRKRVSGCSGTVNNKLYHCFGLEAAGSILSHCDIYDLNVGDGYDYIHSSYGTGLMARYGLSCVFTGGYMYVIGGIVSGVFSNEMHRLDLTTTDTTTLQSYPFGVYFPSAVLYKGDIVVCGGSHVRSPTEYTEICKKYIIATNQWVTFPSFNVHRYQHTLVNWGTDKILAIGGRNEVNLRSIEVYENGGWSTFTDLPAGTVNTGLQVINLDED